MTPASFRIAFPAFVDQKESDIQRHINAAVPYFDTGLWGDRYEEGVGCFVAHRILCEAADAKPGAAFGTDVSAKTIAGVSKVKAGEMLMKEMEDPFQRTRYGQRYSAMAEQVGMRAVAI